MSKRVLWIFTIALSVTMAALVVVQVTWIKNAVQLKDEQFRQLVNNALSDVSRQLDSYYTDVRMHRLIEDQQDVDFEGQDWELDVKSADKPKIIAEETENKEIIIIPEHEAVNRQEILVSKVMERILLEELSFEEKIDQETLVLMIKKNLNNRGLAIPFEYAILKDNKKQIYASEAFSLKTDYYYFRVGLLNDKLEDDETLLYIYLPDQDQVVRGSLSVLAPVAVGLTFFMLVLFAFALYVIFKQKRLSDVKNDFVNNMTHELKTPISTISLASQMLSDNSIPDEQKKIGNISRIIQTESKRLGYQVERVLQMAVLDQGHLVLKKSETDMEEIVSMVMMNFKIQVESRNGKLELLNEMEKAHVNGDKVHLMNVVTNLMDNAVKYSKDKPEITVRMYNVGKNFGLSVKDNGIGISRDDQKRVFDKFYRVSTGNVHDVKGFGLGLSYVKLIIDQHGGAIHMNSEIGKGTQFDLLLPLCIEK